MAVDNTLLMTEVSAVIREGDGIQRTKMDVRIKTPTQWLDPNRVTLLSIERDYESSYGDVIVVEVSLGYGDYTYQVVPNKDNLFVDLSIEPIRMGIVTADSQRKTKRYRAVLMDNGSPALTDRSPQASSQDDLNQSKFKSIQLQLIDEGLYQIRMMTVGRLYRQIVPMMALQSLLSETMSLVDSTRQQQVFGLNVVDGYNESPIAHAIIPHGMPLTAVKDYLQDQEGGIYSTGMGCYLQHGYWYLFPLYDTTRWKRTPRTLTVLNIPPNRYRAGDRTFRKTKHQVVIVTAGNSSMNDEGLGMQLNEGNAYRFTQANNLLNYATTENNTTKVERNKNVFEVQGIALKSGKTNAQWSPNRATTNPFTVYSDMAKRNGRYLSIQWLHGDSSLLYPGMPVKFLSAVGEKLETFYGVLLGVQEQKIPERGGVGVEDFSTAVQLKLFLGRLDTAV